MPELAFIPLDDRPCCWQFPLRLAEIGGVGLAMPPDALWRGADKRQSDSFNKNAGALLRWLKKRFSGTFSGSGRDECQALLGSWDMICCGGLVASRCPGAGGQGRHTAAKFARLLQTVRAYMFTTVMRTAPTQRTAEEVSQAERLVECSCRLGRKLASEGVWPGAGAFYRGECGGPVQETIRSFGIDSGFWRRYCEYRLRKHLLNIKILKAWKHEVLSRPSEAEGRGYLAVGLDDTKTAGLNILEVEELRSIFSNPEAVSAGAGTDETACLLLARAIAKGTRLRAVWPFRGAEEEITLYEGQPLGEVLRSQAQCAGAVIAEEVFAGERLDRIADRELNEVWIYAPFGKQQEAVRQKEAGCDLPEKLMQPWLEALEETLHKGRRVFIADLAYANGGSLRLFEALKERGLWKDICGYAAWNTAGNALGTVLAWAAVYKGGGRGLLNRRFLAERLLDDLYYQSVLRPRLSAAWGGAFVFLPGDKLAETEAALAAEMNKLLEAELKPLLGLEGCAAGLRVSFPWGRLFEAEADLSLQPRKQ